MYQRSILNESVGGTRKSIVSMGDCGKRDPVQDKKKTYRCQPSGCTGVADRLQGPCSGSTR
jgi:hypothetical protein